MNDKIQEIISDSAQSVFRECCLRPEPGYDAAFDLARTRSIILRAVLEVIGEAGVEGALEKACCPLGATPAVPLYAAYHAELNKEAVTALTECRAALRTLKELHQSAAGKETQ